MIDCLEYLVPELQSINAKVVGVDNCSQDNSVPIIHKWIAEQSAGDFFNLLNSDTLVRKCAVLTLLELALSHKAAGLIIPRLEWRDSIR